MYKSAVLITRTYVLYNIRMFIRCLTIYITGPVVCQCVISVFSRLMTYFLYITIINNLVLSKYKFRIKNYRNFQIVL